jgi:hypothetical protein
MMPVKKILFASSFGGIFDFFVIFNSFGKRIKEYYVTKEERVLKTYKFNAQGKDLCSK